MYGRDIKLENTLLDAAEPQPNVKICDFGYSKNEFVDSRPKTVSGTPDYIAPEVLMADQYDGKTRRHLVLRRHALRHAHWCADLVNFCWRCHA